jgi:hypothetical protein
LDPLLFLVYINDLLKAVKHKALPNLFADDTHILITSPNNIHMQSDLNIVFEQLNNWFKSNLLLLIFTKLTLFNLTIKVNTLLINKLNMKINKYS